MTKEQYTDKSFKQTTMNHFPGVVPYLECTCNDSWIIVYHDECCYQEHTNLGRGGESSYHAIKIPQSRYFISSPSALTMDYRWCFVWNCLIHSLEWELQPCSCGSAWLDYRQLIFRVGLVSIFARAALFIHIVIKSFMKDIILHTYMTRQVSSEFMIFSFDIRVWPLALVIRHTFVVHKAFKIDKILVLKRFACFPNQFEEVGLVNIFRWSHVFPLLLQLHFKGGFSVWGKQWQRMISFADHQNLYQNSLSDVIEYWRINAHLYNGQSCYHITEGWYIGCDSWYIACSLHRKTSQAEGYDEDGLRETNGWMPAHNYGELYWQLLQGVGGPSVSTHSLADSVSALEGHIHLHTHIENVFQSLRMWAIQVHGSVSTDEMFWVLVLSINIHCSLLGGDFCTL